MKLREQSVRRTYYKLWHILFHFNEKVLNPDLGDAFARYFKSRAIIKSERRAFEFRNQSRFFIYFIFQGFLQKGIKKSCSTVCSNPYRNKKPNILGWRLATYIGVIKDTALPLIMAVTVNICKPISDNVRKASVVRNRFIYIPLLQRNLFSCRTSK